MIKIIEAAYVDMLSVSDSTKCILKTLLECFPEFICFDGVRLAYQKTKLGPIFEENYKRPFTAFERALKRSGFIVVQTTHDRSKEWKIMELT